MSDGDAADAVEADGLDEAFASWIEGQRAALAIMGDAEVPATNADRAEGFRWLTRLASLAQDWFVERADPLHPDLFVAQTAHRKLLVDNPDVQYRFAVLDDTRTYRLRGRRGEAAYVGLTFGTPFGKGAVGGRTGTLNQVHLDQFELGPDGEVDLVISPAPRPATVAGGRGDDDATPNWIELVPGTGQVAVRETFFDRRTEQPAELHLELVGEAPPVVCDPATLADQLTFAGLFVQFVAATAVNMWRDTAGEVNRFGGTAGSAHVAAQDDEVRTHSDADMTYHGGRWVLGEGQALVVTVPEPTRPFLYWGLTIANPWMESYDYRYATTCLNNRRAERSPDGSWRLVIAPDDPGVPNWLDTGGRHEGYMIVRWVLADEPAHPVCAVVSLAELRGGAGGTT